MTEAINYIPNRVRNAAVGGHVCGAVDIVDDALGLEQSSINEDVASMPYNDGNPNGMGRIILKKTDNFKNVVEAQSGNTIFVIKYDFTLTGDVTIPTNCILEFDGGSLNNGNIDFNLCQIIAPIHQNIFNNITPTGFILSDNISVKWFGAVGNSEHDDTNAIKQAVAATKNSTGTLYFPVPQSQGYLITDTITTNSIHIKGQGGNDVVTILANGNFLAFDIYGVGLHIQDLNVYFINHGINSVGFQFNGFNKSEAKMLRVRYANIAFKLGDTGGAVSWGSSFEFCSADYPYNKGFDFNSTIGTTTLYFNKCHVTGTPTEEIYPKGFDFHNIANLYFNSCYTDHTKGFSLNCVNCGDIMINQYIMEAHYFKNGESALIFNQCKKVIIEDLQDVDVRVESSGGHVVYVNKTTCFIKIDKTMLGLRDYTDVNLLRIVHNSDSPSTIININTVNSPKEIIDRCNTDGYDALVLYNGKRWVRSYAYLNINPVPKGEIVYIEPTQTDDSIIYGYLKISDNSTSIIGTDYIPIAVAL